MEENPTLNLSPCHSTDHPVRQLYIGRGGPKYSQKLITGLTTKNITKLRWFWRYSGDEEPSRDLRQLDRRRWGDGRAASLGPTGHRNGCRRSSWLWWGAYGDCLSSAEHSGHRVGKIPLRSLDGARWNYRCKVDRIPLQLAGHAGQRLDTVNVDVGCDLGMGRPFIRSPLGSVARDGLLRHVRRDMRSDIHRETGRNRNSSQTTGRRNCSSIGCRFHCNSRSDRDGRFRLGHWWFLQSSNLF